MAISMVEASWPFRTLLFIPAHRKDWVEKCDRFNPQAVILDLEDSVVAERKSSARQLVSDEIDILVSMHIAPFVRLNSLAEGAYEDIRYCVKRGLKAVVLPKTNGPEDVVHLAEKLSDIELAAGLPKDHVSIIPLPETARGAWMAHEIASASNRVKGLMAPVSGPVSGDLSQAIGYLPTMSGEEQLFIQSHTILASRAAGASHPIACIFGTQIGDLASVEVLAVRAKRLGFSGVAVIHPSHVRVVENAYRPSAEEVEYAKGMLEALKAANRCGHGAARYRGQMVDAAMVANAEYLVAWAERSGRSQISSSALP